MISSGDSGSSPSTRTQAPVRPSTPSAARTRWIARRRTPVRATRRGPARAVPAGRAGGRAAGSSPATRTAATAAATRVLASGHASRAPRRARRSRGAARHHRSQGSRRLSSTCAMDGSPSCGAGSTRSPVGGPPARNQTWRRSWSSHSTLRTSRGPRVTWSTCPLSARSRGTGNPSRRGATTRLLRRVRYAGSGSTAAGSPGAPTTTSSTTPSARARAVTSSTRPIQSRRAGSGSPYSRTPHASVSSADECCRPTNQSRSAWCRGQRSIDVSPCISHRGVSRSAANSCACLGPASAPSRNAPRSSPSPGPPVYGFRNTGPGPTRSGRAETRRSAA